ncbi:MAG TPA: sulfatase-like hydrolase/transferase [Candidatus Koribacter sp.]|jgi:arylsulfatase A-like enzyme
MQRSRWTVLAARVVFLAYTLFTSAYCLLAYIPFTYQQVHVGELLPLLTRLAHLHALLYWPAFGAALYTILPEHRPGIGRTMALATVPVGLTFGIGFAIHPLLPNLKNDLSSLVWSLVSMLALLWVAAIDWLHARPSISWKPVDEDESGRIFTASFQTSLYAAAVYFLIVVLRISNSTNLDFTTGEWVSVLLWSVLSHLLVFFLIFAVFDLGLIVFGYVQQVTGRAKAGSAVSILVVVLLVAVALMGVVFPPITFQGFAAWIAAMVIGFCIVGYAVGAGLRLLNDRREVSGLRLLVEPFAFLTKSNWLAPPAALTALALIVWICSSRVSRLDWGFVVQKMIVMLVWSVAFAILYTTGSRWVRYSRLWAYVAGVAVLISYTALVVAEPRAQADNSAATTIGRVLDGFEGYDVSFRLADQALRPPVAAHTGRTGNFFSFLAENTNIPRSIHVEPVDIRLVQNLAPDSRPKPNIFFIVIDSLRRDYVSAYNADVGFTPAMGAFAKNSVVFENAFTRYGGTGLSEPSIWVGGELLHQQYESPFAPMNSLQKLLQVNHYREWISRDNILQQVVPDSKNIDELDKNIGTMHYDLCTTLQELTGRLPAVKEGPVFVYTQAQNIHVSVIDRESRSVPAGESFPPAFNGAYASRLRNMDACFGNFIEALKKQGVYDNSLIVLTSDHGDSLGENGRWGHAYTIFPEVVRIPLIVHLPAMWRNKVADDPQEVTFLTDLTPSLFYLLGQKQVMNNPLFGHPLFTGLLDEQKPYETDSQLLVSSYGPVYGLLSDNGKRLYIADGVNYRDYAFDLSPDGSSKETSLTEEQRAEAQRKIRQQVEDIAHFYGWH